jgi:hypothetical protein
MKLITTTVGARRSVVLLDGSFRRKNFFKKKHRNMGDQAVQAKSTENTGFISVSLSYT